ncbi:MAG: DOMON-like domain-containing protein [Betaproteobacteria bacterium]|nr:DOMON-like domain-containing protein [Betaproteobacteria bacterium]MCL2885948.1 DOMON-like domain-containing protein [Betaproteobacteria bacterium]
MPVSQPLRPHPALPAPAGLTLTVDCVLGAAGIELCYRYHGDPAALRLPAPQVAGPADDLWRHTCCEAFVAGAASPGYREFNFSPAGQWAAYRFAAYRQRDTSEPPPAALPPIRFSRRADGFDLRATIPDELLPAGPLHLGLCAVIARADGGMDYWALAHGGERPDFHLRPSFTLQLSRP